MKARKIQLRKEVVTSKSSPVSLYRVEDESHRIVYIASQDNCNRYAERANEILRNRQFVVVKHTI